MSIKTRRPTHAPESRKMHRKAFPRIQKSPFSVKGMWRGYGNVAAGNPYKFNDKGGRCNCCGYGIKLLRMFQSARRVLKGPLHKCMNQHFKRELID